MRRVLFVSVVSALFGIWAPSGAAAQYVTSSVFMAPGGGQRGAIQIEMSGVLTVVPLPHRICVVAAMGLGARYLVIRRGRARVAIIGPAPFLLANGKRRFNPHASSGADGGPTRRREGACLDLPLGPTSGPRIRVSCSTSAKRETRCPAGTAVFGTFVHLDKLRAK